MYFNRGMGVPCRYCNSSKTSSYDLLCYYKHVNWGRGCYFLSLRNSTCWCTVSGDFYGEIMQVHYYQLAVVFNYHSAHKHKQNVPYMVNSFVSTLSRVDPYSTVFLSHPLPTFTPDEKQRQQHFVPRTRSF